MHERVHVARLMRKTQKAILAWKKTPSKKTFQAWRKLNEHLMRALGDIPRRNPEDTDSAAATDLAIFIINDRLLYQNQALYIMRNLARKMHKRTYNGAKALKLWYYLAGAGAQKYHRELVGGSSKWFKMFNLPTRKAAAKKLAEHYHTELLDTFRYNDKALPQKKKNPGPRKRKSFMQALLFSRPYWTHTKVSAYLHRHFKGRYSRLPAHTTEKYIRIRISDPSNYGRMRIKALGKAEKHVKIIFGFK